MRITTRKLMASVGFVLAGFPAVTDFFQGFAPAWLVDAIRNMSFLERFGAAQLSWNKGCFRIVGRLTLSLCLEAQNYFQQFLKN